MSPSGTTDAGCAEPDRRASTAGARSRRRRGGPTLETAPMDQVEAQGRDRGTDRRPSNHIRGKV